MGGAYDGGMLRAGAIVVVLGACGGTPVREEPAEVAVVAVRDAGVVMGDAGAPDADGGDAEVADNVGRLYSEHGDFGEAFAWLVAHPDRARPALRDVVEGENWSMATERALMALGRIGDARDVDVIQTAMHGDSETVRETAAQALALHPAPEAERALMTALDGPEAGVAATALGDRKAEAARGKMEALLQAPDASVRYRVVRALGVMGAARSDAALRKLARRERDRDVKTALRALGY
jgi:hypothetical protein